MRHPQPAGLIAIALAVCVAFIGIGIVEPILPVIAAQLGASHASVSWLFSSYILAMSLTMLVAGPLIERFGPRWIIGAALGLVTLFALLTSLASTIPALTALRAGWGFGAALFTTTALVAMMSFAARPAVASRYFEGALALGMALGPLLGGFLSALSWRAPLLAAAALSLVTVVFVLRRVPLPTQVAHSGTPVGVGLVLANFRSVRFSALVLSGLFYNFAYFALISYAPLWLPMPAERIGMVLFAWGLAMALGATVLSGLLTRRLAPAYVIGLSSAALLIVFTLLAAVPGLPVPLEAALVILTGLLFGLGNPLFTPLAGELGSGPRSVRVGAFNFGRWLGASAAPVLCGYLGERFWPELPFAVVAVALALGLGSLGVAVWRARYTPKTLAGAQG
ncbi:MFS family permease [Deinobacterium chartae]|uniref:MFS family permease n=1 Tax=Deinobacterium chartae TaxID=521158 RepID=A0A841I447_9DEIO|nr:MFS transporter [Deinobacterium chartae]MBB6098772.1 MFS family permease [Deinobacterium chartae]